MYDYNADNVLQRQRVCYKCSSFVTHEKGEDGAVVCPLCSNEMKASKPKTKPIYVKKMNVIVKQFYESIYGKPESQGTPNKDSEVDTGPSDSVNVDDLMAQGGEQEAQSDSNSVDVDSLLDQQSENPTDDVDQIMEQASAEEGSSDEDL